MEKQYNKNKKKAWIAVGMVLFAVLWFPCIWISWGIVALGAAYAGWHVWQKGRNWWKRRHSRVAKRERMLLFLVSLMGFFLMTGTALFLAAFRFENIDYHWLGDSYLFVNAEYLLRSMVCSLDLFMLDIDSNVLDGISEHPYLKGMISVQAVFSFSCTVAVLISLVYFRIKAYFKLHRRTVVDGNHNHLYVFFGLNEASRLLAKSIRKEEKERALIVIVEKSIVDDEDRGAWDSIVGMFTHREQIFIDAEETGARVTFTETLICDIDKKLHDREDILGELNLEKLRELIRELQGVKENPQLHVFFLSENEDENIRSVSVLSHDGTINDCVGKNTSLRIYCHARRNGLNRVVEDVEVKRGLDVCIVDSAHLSIELLKSDVKNHPVKLVEVDAVNPTTVKSDFQGLVVGFDEVGQDALRFLYEFGAFVDSSASVEDEWRSPFRCTVVDVDMESRRGVFETFAPAAVAARNADGSPLVSFVECDCRSREFFNKALAPVCGNLNYVVIAVGDDELGMLLAVRIFNYVRRERQDLSRFRIFVRSYKTDRAEYMRKIAAHYNEGYNSDCSDEKFKTPEIIVPFGQKDSIYTYDMIVGEKFIRKGKCFYENYARIKNETETWDERRDVLMGAKEYEKDENGKTLKDKNGKKILKDIPICERVVSLNNLRSLRRKETQDLANALHVDTKLYLLESVQPGGFDWNGLFGRYFDSSDMPEKTGEFNGISYPKLTAMENRAILNLARLEHLRWNASHEMLGYTKADGRIHCCDERTRQHNCLRPWQELDGESRKVSELEGWDADYKSYDFAVVDTTLQLHKSSLSQPVQKN